MEKTIAICKHLYHLHQQGPHIGGEAPPISNPLNPGAQHGPI